MLFASSLGELPSSQYSCSASGICKPLTEQTKAGFAELQTSIQQLARLWGVSVQIVVDGVLGPATFKAYQTVGRKAQGFGYRAAFTSAADLARFAPEVTGELKAGLAKGVLLAVTNPATTPTPGQKHPTVTTNSSSVTIESLPGVSLAPAKASFPLGAVAAAGGLMIAAFVVMRTVKKFRQKPALQGARRRRRR